MQTTTFIIHAYDEVEPIDIGATFGVLSMAKRVDPGIEMALVARKAGPVRLANGLEINAPYGVADCPAGDVLKSWHTVNHVAGEMKPVDVIQHRHVERSGDRSLFLIATYVQVAVIGSAIGQADRKSVV